MGDTLHTIRCPEYLLVYRLSYPLKYFPWLGLSSVLYRLTNILIQIHITSRHQTGSRNETIEPTARYTAAGCLATAPLHNQIYSIWISISYLHQLFPSKWRVRPLKHRVYWNVPYCAQVATLLNQTNLHTTIYFYTKHLHFCTYVRKTKHWFNLLDTFSSFTHF